MHAITDTTIAVDRSAGLGRERPQQADDAHRRRRPLPGKQPHYGDGP
jgi:hypothetical protein